MSPETTPCSRCGHWHSISASCSQFDPDWVVAPAETLRDWMQEQGVDIHELSRRSSIEVHRLEKILDPGRTGRGSFGAPTACKLQQGTGISARFWMQLESMFRTGLEAGKTWMKPE